MIVSQSRSAVSYEARKFTGGGLLGTDLSPSAVVGELVESRENVEYLDHARAAHADWLTAVSAGEVALGGLGAVLAVVSVAQWVAIRRLRRDVSRLTAPAAPGQFPRVGVSS